MNNINIEMCRSMLKLLMEDVRKVTTPAQRKASWVYRSDRCWEFHGPNNFYWYGRADNAYEARYNGWTAYLESTKP